jgi:Ser/Thr protein kinase RdoA (MazF antagonist)
MHIPDTILHEYGIPKENAGIKAFGTGLINHTWKVISAGKSYIFQRINNEVFKTPPQIAANIHAIAIYLKQHFPEYLFVAPLPSITGEEMVYTEEEGGNYFRVFPFIEGSHTIDVVKNAEQAYEAALQFGKFTKLLSGFDAEKLQITLPSFHDLSLRYRQFSEALESGNPQRISESAALIRFVKDHVGIVSEYEYIKKNPAFKKRVTHHDTKISNVLFGADDKALCVIDLDTIMPGYFISDVGDMMRTYLPTVSEEEKDFTKIQVRDEIYRAIVEGYSTEMQTELSADEKRYFFYAGVFMIYMQALRFLTDYINNDIYYGAGYPNHNFVRAGNQVVLLQSLLEKRPVLE